MRALYETICTTIALLVLLGLAYIANPPKGAIQLNSTSPHTDQQPFSKR